MPESMDIVLAGEPVRLLADRALSRLLKDDWPRSLEELEEFKAARRQG